MKTKYSLCTLLILFMLSFLLTGFSLEKTDNPLAQQQPETTYSHNRIIIKFKEVYTKTYVRDAFRSIETLNREHNIQFSEALSTGTLFPLHNNRTNTRVESVKNKFTKRSKRMPGTKKIPDLSRIYILTISGNTDINRLCNEYTRDPYVEYAQPDYIMKTTMVPDDPYYHSSGSWGQDYDDMWNLKIIEMEQAWDITMGEGMIVAVVDTGVDYTHEDIRENIWTNPDEIADNGIDDDGNGFVDDVNGWDFIGESSDNPREDNDPMDKIGHGTHVAGTIAATGNNSTGIIGVAPEAKIMALKGFPDEPGPGLISTLGKAIVYAAENGADVINNSWGGGYLPRDPFMEEIITYAHALGLVIVFAAGNDSFDVNLISPQNMSETISVGATSQDDAPISYSNYGSFLDICAPGGGNRNPPPQDYPQRNILSLKIPANGQTLVHVGDNYLRNGGTSMAAPHVSGVVALILAQNPGLSNIQVKDVLRRSADDIGAAGFDPATGWGRVNAYRALQIEDVVEISMNITSPDNNYSIDNITNNTIAVTGTASGPDFQSYRLFYSQGWGAKEWVPFGEESTSAIENGILGLWHISNLPFNSYWLRLSVTTNDNTVLETQQKILSLPLHRKISRQREAYMNMNISGNSVTWSDRRNRNSDIFLYDVTTDIERQLTIETTGEHYPKLSGDTMVWCNRKDIFDWKFIYYDIMTSEEKQIHLMNALLSDFDYSRDTIAWIDDRDNGNDNVYTYNLKTNVEQKIIDGSQHPDSVAIDGKYLVWDEHDFEKDYFEVHLYDMAAGSKIFSHTHNNLDSPKISKNHMIWSQRSEEIIPLEDEPVSANDIFMYSIVDDKIAKITSETGIHWMPDIYGDYIVWSNIANGGNIFLYELKRKRTHQITEGTGYDPVVSESAVVWRDKGSDNRECDLFALEIKGTINVDYDASSARAKDYGPLKAVDGDPSTRWISSAADSEWISVDFKHNVLYNRIDLRWAGEYAYEYEIQGSRDGQNWEVLISAENQDGDLDSFYLDEQNHRHVRISGMIGTSGYYSLNEFEVYYDKPTAYASTSGSLETGPEKAIDANGQTMWTSGENEDEWIFLDLKRPMTFDSITLEWADKYAEKYEIQVADAGENWQTIYTEALGSGGTDHISFSKQTTRFLKLRGISSSTKDGYSLYEIKVTGDKCLEGDVQNDGNVDIVDALLTAQYYVGILSEIDECAADVNCDGDINIVDALVIARYYVGIITQFPCQPAIADQ